MQPRRDFDLICLGSGPAGQKAAIQAAKAGFRAAVIEREPQVGGSCLLVGNHPEQGAARTGAALSAHARQRLVARGRTARRCAAVGAAARRRCGDRRAGSLSAGATRAQPGRIDPRPRQLLGRAAHRSAASGRRRAVFCRRRASCSPPARGRVMCRRSRSTTSTSSTATRF